MLSNNDALTYKDQLHPAYAGYLFDGEINDKDILATVFQLMKTGCIMPVFEDNNMTKRIIGLVRTSKTVRYGFETELMNKIFSDKNEVSTKRIGELIQSDILGNILLHNLKSITEFPLINKKLEFILGDKIDVDFTVNGKPVTDLKTAAEFKNAMKLILPLFIFIGLAGFLFSLGTQTLVTNVLKQIPSVTISVSPNFAGPIKFNLLFPLLFIGIPALMFFVFNRSDKIVSYDFKNKIIPFSKEKYRELYEFLKTRPLDDHNFNNEFLPYSIAFGLDKSWNKDFYLNQEVDVTKSSLIK